MVGVDEKTIRRDMGAANAAPEEENPRNDAVSDEPIAANAAPEQIASPPDPPLLAVVDLETGEIVEPEPVPVVPLDVPVEI